MIPGGGGMMGGGHDPYWGNVKALLHLNGVDTSTTFTDQRGHTFTAAGNAQIDTGQSKFGGASLQCDGTGDFIYSTDVPEFDMGSSDFTVELFVRMNSTTDYRVLCSKRANASAFSGIILYTLVTSNLPVFAATVNGTSWGVSITGTTGLSVGTWYHIAATRSGDSWRLFVNGTQEGGTTTLSGTVPDNADSLRIGGDSDSYSLDGWIDEFRLTKGVARYTSNFTAPTAPFFDR